MAFGGNFHINKALTNVSVKYSNNEFIAGQAIKDIAVKNESDVYYSYNRSFKLPDTLRANKSPSNQHSWDVSTVSYTLNEHALSDVITDRDKRNSDTIRIEADTVENLTDKIMLRQEYEMSKLIFTTGSWTNNETILTATSWDYAAGTSTSLPIKDVLEASASIVKNAGKRANTMIMGWETFEVLKENPNVYDRIKYVERAIITEDLLSAVFDIDNVYVGTGVYDTTADGLTESMGYLWGPDALVCYINPNMGLKQVTAVSNLRINEAGNPYKVKKWRREELSGDQIEVSTMFKPKIICDVAGYFFKNCNES